MDNDVFEDFPSDQEFSDVEEEDGEGKTALSDDEIARVLGLMDSGAAVPVVKTEFTKVKTEETKDVGVMEAVMKAGVSDLDGRSVVGRAGEEVAPLAVVEPRRQLLEPEMSDFDRFLENFTRQQLPQKKKEHASETNTAADPQYGGDAYTPAPNRTSVVTAAPVHQPPQSSTDTSKTDVPVLRWGVFIPDKMPVRRECGSVSSVLSTSTLSPVKTKDLKLKTKSKLRVLVPSVAFLRTKNRRPQRTSDPSDKELSFRPTINKAYYRRRGMVRLRGQSKDQFAARMQKDIDDRHARQQKRVDERQQQEEADVKQLQERRRSLVAKGSQAILERNGLWEESMDHRLERLVKGSHGRPRAKQEDPSTRSKRKKALRDKEKAKTRACESLYKRGVDKLKRTRDGEKSTPSRQERESRRRRTSSSRHTDELVRKRLEREVSMICSSECGSVHSLKSDSNNSIQAHTPLALPASVSFVEFSCVLLYFGLVPDANTHYEGNSEVTLLWHAWLVFATGEGDDRRVSMQELKKLLDMVIVDSTTPLHSNRKTKRSDDSAKVQLLKLFRVNYLGRTRSRAASTAATDPSSIGNKRTNAKSKSSKTTYSLHGRALRPHEQSGRVSDLLAARHDSAQQRIEELRRAKQQEELAECTFKPRIAPASSSSDAERQGYKFRSFQDDEDAPETFERLYSDAFVRQNNNMVRSYRARIEADEKWKREMHISPTYVNGLTIDERLQKLHESLSNNALPVNFHQKIAEMRKAYATKADEEREKQSRLEPAAHCFPKTREGHTLVVPFTFATEERQLQSRLRTDHPRGSTLKARSPHAKSTSALIRELRFQFESPMQDFVGGDEEQRELDDDGEDTGRVADLCIDVHVSPLETYQLCLNRDDDVEEATRLFADTYNLDLKQRTQLAKHAAAQLEQLFDL